MKKFISIMLTALTIVICLTACGKQEADSDLQYIQDKGTLIVGMTEYAPMDYRDENGEWTGFDAELGRLVADRLGVEIQFVVLPDWSQKFAELNARNIDVIWNGMTITEEVKNNTSYTRPYLMNAQVVVMPKDRVNEYTDPADLQGLSFAVENGSAGQAALDALGIAGYAALQDQPAAILEVKAGASDACVVDITVAKAMTGENGDFSDLAIGLSLTEEQYGIAFRKGSDVTEQVNGILEDLTADGTLAALAEKYNLTLAD